VAYRPAAVKLSDVARNPDAMPRHGGILRTWGGFPIRLFELFTAQQRSLLPLTPRQRPARPLPDGTAPLRPFVDRRLPRLWPTAATGGAASTGTGQWPTQPGGAAARVVEIRSSSARETSSETCGPISFSGCSSTSLSFCPWIVVMIGLS